MDQEILVKAGHLITAELIREGLAPRAVLWVHTTDTDTWKLWIIPPDTLTDKREFYRRIAGIVTKHRSSLGGVDAADVEMISKTHPAIRGLQGAFRVTGQSVIHVKSSVFNGFYLTEAIILHMDL